MGYCSSAAVFAKAPPGTFAAPGRIVDSVSVSADTLTLSGHGLETDDAVTLRADAGGSLPAPLAAGTTYYAIVVSDALFQLSETQGGAAIDITTEGANVVLIRALPVDEWIAHATALLDDTLPAHVVPITGTVPQVVADACACLAAHEGLVFVGASTEDLDRAVERAQKQLDKGARGVPIRGADAPASAGLSSLSAVAFTSRDPRGWGNEDGTLP